MVGHRNVSEVDHIKQFVERARCSPLAHLLLRHLILLEALIIPLDDMESKQDFLDSDLKPDVEHVQHLENVAAQQKSEAQAQETLEHNMTIREAVEAYPMACFWAFIMAFTIVCTGSFRPSGCPGSEASFCHRSWNRSICF
jgi:hypothetical protein